MDKASVAAILDEIGALLELKGENPFKVRAYRNAARVLEGEAGELEDVLGEGRLEALPGIGKALAGKIRELAVSGRLAYYEELKASVPPGLLDILRLQGVGPKRAKALRERLGVASVAELERVCRAGRLAGLEGFGEKSQGNILRAIEERKASSGFFLGAAALREAEKIAAHLRAAGGVARLEVAGSLRRRKEIVRDIDILACAERPERLHAALASYGETASVLAHGETKSSVVLKSGIQCDLRTVTASEFPYALQYFTGSKEHNVALRTEIKKRGYKISEYGLWKKGRRVPCRDETALYEALGFHYVPPELREGKGELAAARRGAFPRLIETSDLRGLFHVHSTYSDGTASLADMVAEAERLGYAYVGVSDHSRTARYANGLEPARLKAQRREIESLRKKRRIAVFWGIESDILPDGRLDYPDAVLREFDFVIGSVHSHFHLPEAKQTERLLKAMDSRYLTFLGHPTGRLLLARSGYALDMRRVLAGAAERGVAVEFNANPHRLDLDWRWLPEALRLGARLGIHPDAHSKEGLRDVEYALGVARKGGVRPGDVVNALSLSEVERFLRLRR